MKLYGIHISVSINKVLLAHVHTYLCTYGLWWPVPRSGRAEVSQEAGRPTKPKLIATGPLYVTHSVRHHAYVNTVQSQRSMQCPRTFGRAYHAHCLQGESNAVPFILLPCSL